MYQDATWYEGRPQPRRHCDRWGPSSPPLKGHSPQFSAVGVCCGQAAGWTKMPLGTEVGLGPGDFMFDGDPAPPRKKGTAPHQFLAHVCCGQTARSMKVLFDTEVLINLGPGDAVLGGVTASPCPLKRGTVPQFLADVCCGQTAGWMKMPLGTEVDLGLGHIV